MEEIAPPKKRKNSRAKGANAERELLSIFKLNMEQVESDLAKIGAKFHPFSEEARRTAKPRFSIGEDFAGIPLLAIECKFTSQNLIDAHWQQTLQQARKGKFPVLFSKKARRGWRVRSYASLQSPQQTGIMLWVVVDYSIGDFFVWYKQLYRELLLKTGSGINREAGSEVQPENGKREAGSWYSGSGKRL